MFSVVGVDVGFDNPVFAMIELEYSEVTAVVVIVGLGVENVCMYNGRRIRTLREKQRRKWRRN